MSIKKIKEICPGKVLNSFKFEPVIEEDTKEEIQNLILKKLSIFGFILVTMLNECADVYLSHLTNFANHILQKRSFHTS